MASAITTTDPLAAAAAAVDLSDFEEEEEEVFKNGEEGEEVEDSHLTTVLTELCSSANGATETTTIAELAGLFDRYYRALTARYVDVFSEFGATAPFIIDGDALLAHCLEDPLVDWTHGGQPLHVCYTVQAFLHALQVRDARFRVVFFDSYTPAWRGAKATLRAALVQQLRESTAFPIDTLPSPLGAEFESYRELHLPAFVLTKHAYADGTDTDDATMALGPLQGRVLMAQLLGNGTPVVLFTRPSTEFRGPKLQGFFINPHSQTVDALTAAAAKVLQATATTTGTAGGAATRAFAPGAAAEELLSAKAHARLICGTAAVANLTEVAGVAPEVVSDLSRAFLAHLVFMGELPLSARALALPDPAGSEAEAVRTCSPHLSALDSFLEALWPHMLAAVTWLTPSTVAIPSMLAEGLADLWDGRTLQAVLLAAHTGASLGLSEAGNKTLLKISGGVDGDEKLPLLRDASVSTEAAQSAAAALAVGTTAAARSHKEAAATASESSSASQQQQLLPMQNSSFLQKTIADVCVELKPLESRAHGEGIVASQLAARSPWQSAPPLELGDHYGIGVTARQQTSSSEGKELYDMMKKFAHMLFARGPVQWAELTELGNNCADKLQRVTKKEADIIRDCLAARNIHDIKGLVRRRVKKLNPDKVAQNFATYTQAVAESLRGGPIQAQTIIERASGGVGATKQHQQQKRPNVSAQQLRDLKKCVTAAKANVADEKKRFEDIERKARRHAVRKEYTQAWKLLDEYKKAGRKILGKRRAQESGEVHPIRDVLEQVAAKLAKQAKGKKSGGDAAGGKKSKGKGKPKGQAGGMAQAFDEAESLLRDYDGFDAISKLEDLYSIETGRLRVFGVTIKWWSGYVSAIKAAASKGDAEAKAVAADREEWAASVVLTEILDVFEAHLDRFESEGGMQPCAPEATAHAETLVKAVLELGFSELGPRLAGVWESRCGASMDAKKALDVVEPRVAGRCGFNEFQLRMMAPRLPRPRNSPDARTHGHFNPDGWQRELLDNVDAGRSSIISAPTSSGKTFICYYAMEQVLAEASKGDGVIVYIAPTKALVNQVEAEIYARFVKKYDRPTRKLCGVFTQEYQHDAESCQVLVAMPSCLESLLMSADRVKWARRLRWVIFDEVHCISSRGGEVWEHLLTLIQCPFLALSATIGNPTVFQDWLRSLEASRGRELRAIVHRQRWNDIEPYVYDMDNNELVRLNPIGMLNLASLARRGFPEEMKLLPEHCFQLQRVLFGAVARAADQGAVGPLFEELRRLDPEGDAEDNFFTINWRLTMTAAAEFEQRLKKVFVDLSRLDRTAAQSVIDEISERFTHVIQEERHRDVYNGAALLKTLRTLDTANEEEQRKLPAIVFHLNPRGCERIVRNLTAALEGEQRWEELAMWANEYRREHSSEGEEGQHTEAVTKFLTATRDDNKSSKAVALSVFAERPVGGGAGEEAEELASVIGALEAAKVAAYEKRVEEAKEINAKADREEEAAARRRASKKRKGGDEDDYGDMEEGLTAKRVNFDKWLPGYVSPKHTFLAPGRLVDMEVILQMSGKRHIYADNLAGPFLLQCLMRGVGVHHAHLPVFYRQAVERMMRAGLLRVVVSTSTMALGINMPCRSTILLGDSPDLDPQQYHQMAGRAGRRGFDLRGNVIYMGIPRAKILRLLNSELPALVGNVPLTPTFALRLFLRYTAASDEDRLAVVAAAQRTVQYPFFNVGGANMSRQVAYQFRFILEYLLREGLLQYQGAFAKARAAEEKAASSALAAAGEGEEEEGEEGGASGSAGDWEAEAEAEEEEPEEVPDEWDMSSEEEAEEELGQGGTNKQEADSSAAAAGSPALAAVAGVCEAEVVPAGLCGIASHFFYMEPLNYVFVDWLRLGLFDRLVSRHADNPAERNRKLMTVLAHLIAPHHLSPWQVDAISQDCPNLVRLPALPQEFAAATLAYNARARSTFASLASIFVQRNSAELPSASVLPGTKAETAAAAAAAEAVAEEPTTASATTAAATASEGTVAAALASARLAVGARSPFVALSGHGPAFESTPDLVSSLRTGVYLDTSVVPYFDLNRPETPLNAYALDFYISGSREALSEHNGISASGAYDVIKEVVLGLSIFDNAVKKRAACSKGEACTAVAQAFSELREDYNDKFVVAFAKY